MDTSDACAKGERQRRKRITRLMREAGLVVDSYCRGSPVTTQRDVTARSAPDLVDRASAAEAPNQLWAEHSKRLPSAKPSGVAHVTFVPTAAGFIYLAVVPDAVSPKIVGWTNPSISAT